MKNLVKKNSFILTIILIVVIIGMAISIIFLYIGKEKIGYVDNAVVLENYKKTILVRNEMQLKINEYQAKVNNLQIEIDNARNKFIAQNNKLGNKEKEALKNEITKKEKQYNISVTEARNQLSKIEEQMMGPVIQEVNKLIREYGKKYGYDIIYGATISGNIVYANQSLNLTKKIVKYINKAEIDKNNEDKELKKKNIDTQIN